MLRKISFIILSIFLINSSINIKSSEIVSVSIAELFTKAKKILEDTTCHLCSQRFSNKVSVYEHILAVHVRKLKWKCRMNIPCCQEAFKTELERDQHESFCN